VRLSFRADRADLVVDGLLHSIVEGTFVEVQAEGPGWGSLTALLRQRGWRGLHLVTDLSSQARFQQSDPDCQVVVAGDDDDGLAANSGPVAWRCLHDGRPLHLLCLGAAAQSKPALLEARLRRWQPWIVCIDRSSHHGFGAWCRPMLAEAGYALCFKGPLVEYWVASHAPPELRSFSFAGAVVMPGPAFPAVLLPSPMKPEELLALGDDGFVTAAYWSVLRRAPDEGGRLHYEAVLREGGDRLAILCGMANSDEARARGVGMAYRQLAVSLAVDPPWWRRMLPVARRRIQGKPPAPLARLDPALPMRPDIGKTAIHEQQMDWPHYKISYAQNFEDLVLAGLLKSVSTGFYADVGANHPELDSVTKIFYDKGWRGINIEPNDELFRLLVDQRPRDINVKAAASSQPGSLTLRIYEGLDGLSTISRETQAAHGASQPGRSFRDVHVPVVCLADLFSEHRPAGDIHFLKVDVEGLELEVLLGNDWARFRPWVLCLERNLSAARQEAISTYLKALGYRAVFWDGINDFFVADERQAVWDNFSYANDVVLNGVPVNYIFIRAMVEMAKQATGKG
jgi:FkbM family methyltransferase